MTPYLPREIVLDILSRLPITTLLQCKLVCRAWKNLTQDPLLISMHFSRTGENDPCLILNCDYPIRNQLYYLELSARTAENMEVKRVRLPTLPVFEMVGSCKGLLCFHDWLNKNLHYVHNPFTGDYIQLPESVEFLNQDVVFGFGFHEIPKVYKVIKIIYGTVSRRPLSFFRYISRMIAPESKVQILDTLSSPAWRSMGRIPYRLSQGSSHVLVNGRLHWSTWPQIYRPGSSLISFDLADEQFRVVSKPECDELYTCKFDLVVLGGFLSIAFYFSYEQLQIWLMKEYDVKESWSKEFIIGAQVPRGLEQNVGESCMGSELYGNSSLLRVLCLMKNGDILFEYKCRALVSYNPKNGIFKNVVFQGMPIWCDAVVHEGNLNLIHT